MNTNEEFKKLLERNGSKIMRITFKKKNGDIRHVSTNPKYVNLVDKYKSESTKQAVETRKKNNPTLVNVIDLVKKRKGGSGYVSFYTESIVSVKAGGEVVEFAS